MAGRRAADREGRIGGEAARVAATGAPSASAPPFSVDLDHRHAVRGLRLARPSRRSSASCRRGAAGRRRCTRGSCTSRPRALLPSRGSSACRHGACPSAPPGRPRCCWHRAPRRHVAGHADRLAPGSDDRGAVALGHDQRVLARSPARDLKPSSGPGRVRPWLAQAGQPRRPQPGGQRAQTALQHDAPRRVGHRVDVRRWPLRLESSIESKSLAMACVPAAQRAVPRLCPRRSAGRNTCAMACAGSSIGAQDDFAHGPAHRSASRARARAVGEDAAGRVRDRDRAGAKQLRHRLSRLRPRAQAARGDQGIPARRAGAAQRRNAGGAARARARRSLRARAAGLHRRSADAGALRTPVAAAHLAPRCCATARPIE